MLSICMDCGMENENSAFYSCRSCGGILLVQYSKPDGPLHDPDQNGIWRYHRYLPQVPPEKRLYLGEGMTPLIPSVRLGKQLGVKELYFKYEGGNPTGSYKDRIAAMGVSWALAAGRSSCIGTSSGNAGAAVAAYAVRAGIPYHLFVLEHMAEAKLAQVLVHKAQVRKIKGFGTDPEVGERVFHRIFQAASVKQSEVMITAYRYNPYAMEGVKTVSFEIFEQLRGVPARVYSPAGGGGLYCGLWKGFNELHTAGWSDSIPHITAVQPEGCSNITRAFLAGSSVPLDGNSTSQISGLQVPNPPDGKLALQIMQKGEGSAVMVDDSSVWEAQKLLAEEEGIFCEPAAAASLAGLIRDCRGGISKLVISHERVVCMITGSGFKDSRRLSEMTAHRKVPCIDETEMDTAF